MFWNPKQNALASLVVRSSAIALIAAIMPLGINFDDNGVTISTPEANAKGGGGGGEGGGGQGGGGQGGGGQGGGGHGGGQANGNGAENGVGPGAGRDHGATASGLGRGNAGHAADPAKENAAPHSAVGTAVAYGAAREAADINEQSALEAAVKDATETIGDALADLLGIDD